MAEDGLWKRAAAFSVAHPVAVLLLLVLVQVLPTLSIRSYWAFDEVRHADALRGVLEDGHWFSLHLNGAPYPDKPPVYFWLVAGAATLLGTDGPAAFFLVSGLGGFLFLWATWGLARATIAARRPGLALLAPLLVGSTPLFQLLLRTTRMDLLFGALIVTSTTCLWRGLGTQGDRRFTVLGFALAGLATLVKGPVGLALPLTACVLYLVWTGRARRLLAADVLAGVGSALLLIAGWAVGIGLTEGWGYLGDLLGGQVLARAVLDHKHAQPFFFYLLVLPAACLPWTALLAAFPWRALIQTDTWRALRERRRVDIDGASWVAWTFWGACCCSLSPARSSSSTRCPCSPPWASWVLAGWPTCRQPPPVGCGRWWACCWWAWRRPSSAWRPSWSGPWSSTSCRYRAAWSRQYSCC